MKEQWKDIEGFEDCYQISNFGRVFSKPRVKMIPSKNKNLFERKYGGHQLADYVGRNGYLVNYLTRDGVHKTVTIHSLVAAAFIGPRPDGLCINHIDGDKYNNHATNLEYVTLRENMLHAHRTGLSNNTGDRNGMSKLTNEQAAEVLEKLQGGVSKKLVAAEFGISIGHASDILKGKKWRCLQSSLAP